MTSPVITGPNHSEPSSATVADGATRILLDEDLPVVCAWSVGRIYLTQIGRSARAHEALTNPVSDLCERASPAYDGLEIAV